jgi:type IV pilus assembly protein PilA
MKKGFTLIELLAVIVILGLIAVIVMPAIDKFIKNSRQTTYDSQVDGILQGAKNWSADNISSLPNNNGESIIITLSQLQVGDYVKDDLKNPKTNEPFSGKSTITITNDNGEYIYRFNSSVE